MALFINRIVIITVMMPEENRKIIDAIREKYPPNLFVELENWRYELYYRDKEIAKKVVEEIQRSTLGLLAFIFEEKEGPLCPKCNGITYITFEADHDTYYCPRCREYFFS